MTGNSNWKHPWHDVRIGSKAPEELIGFIECPKGSILKYELDKESGLIILDRVLHSAVHYPGDYGFIPQTLSEDGDPLDIIVIGNYPVQQGVLVKVRPIAVLDMVDGGEADEKIICVHSSDPRLDNKQDLEHVSDHMMREITHFFATYKALENKKVEIKGIRGKEAALDEIRIAIDRYKKQFPKKDNA